MIVRYINVHLLFEFSMSVGTGGAEGAAAPPTFGTGE